ncbi:uncharacterized protein LOC143277104 [Babylonia areolata]|uniref:uncharacterized protein LOC143277104 n=1 Tax=Babylonia areolata TaxID=304850 RepID=UPI003FD343DA
MPTNTYVPAPPQDRQDTQTSIQKPQQEPQDIPSAGPEKAKDKPSAGVEEPKDRPSAGLGVPESPAVTSSTCLRELEEPSGDAQSGRLPGEEEEEEEGIPGGSLLRMEDFIIHFTIASRPKSEVLCAWKRRGENHGKMFAIKKVIKPQKAQKRAFLARELRALRKLKGAPFVVGYHGAINTETHLSMVLDFAAAGDLLGLIWRWEQQNVHFNQQQLRFYLAEVVEALDHVHRNDIIHCDVKPDNILLNKDGHIMLADFGACQFLDNADASDCYSLGVMALHMLLGLGHLPYGKGFGQREWTDVSSEELRASLVDGMKTGVPNVPHTLNPVMRDFVSKLLIVDCSTRLGSHGAFELKSHPFFKGTDWKGVADKRLQPPFVPSGRRRPAPIV